MINPRDIKLISCLRENSRESITNISKKTKIPMSTVFERIEYHKQKTIQKFTALLDFTKFGYMAKTQILIKVHKADKIKLREYLKMHPNINSMYRINNGYDFLIEVIFRNIREIEEFLEELEEKFKIKDSEMHYIIDDLKREEFVPELED